MCGICGFTGEVLDGENVVRAMAQRITHRGPDSSGFYCDAGVSMGFRRLSIIDISESGDQPIYNEDRTLVLTFNGEIYNYRDLRAQLLQAGHVFSTQTDSEVLVHGYEQWGEKLLDRLRGMFAFAIYNTRDRSLFLARDFFGIKPLHYTTVNGHFVYGSEIKSILEFPGFEKKFNMRTLDRYLSFQYAVPPETFFEGVYCLPPAHYLRVSGDGVPQAPVRYWEPRFEPDETMREEDAVNAVAKVFEESVAAHRISDVEVGCFLSSGVDSSYVASYFSGQKTFTVGFGEDEKYNEIGWAKNLSAKIGVEHYAHVITPEEFWGNIRHVQYHMDQPLADPSCIALYFVSKLASEKVKVVLSGEGADELFGGYTIYNEPNSLRGYRKLPRWLRAALRRAVQALPFGFKGKNFLIRGSYSEEELFWGNARMFSFEEKKKLLKGECTRPLEQTRPYYERVKGADEITARQYIDMNFWLVGDILLKADRMSMANSLELRVPFLDKEVFAVASRIPARLRVKDGQTKYAMRQAAQRRLPEVTAQKRKLGFPVPVRVWLREEKYSALVRACFESEPARRFFNTDVLLKYLDDHVSGKADNSRRIWTVFTFLQWYHVYFEDGAHAPGTPPDMAV